MLINSNVFSGQMIQSSLSSKFTKINFFFHNLGQMKHASSSKGPILSFRLVKNVLLCTTVPRISKFFRCKIDLTLIYYFIENVCFAQSPYSAVPSKEARVLSGRIIEFQKRYDLDKSKVKTKIDLSIPSIVPF